MSFLSNGNLRLALTAGGLRLDLGLGSFEKDKQRSIGTRMLHHDLHKPLNQLGENNLARECL